MALDPRFKDRLLLETERTIVIGKLEQLINSNKNNNNPSTSSVSGSKNSEPQSKLRQYFRNKLGGNSVNGIGLHCKEIHVVKLDNIFPRKLKGGEAKVIF